MADDSKPIIPGVSPDPDDAVERSIKAAWALGGMAMSAGVVTYALKGTGFVLLPANPQFLDYARAFAFLIACTNILYWIWFPLDDLRVLRTWIRVKKTAFSAHTSEFLLMMTAALLLIALIVSSTVNALVFGIVGTAVYAVNLAGFAVIRRQVSTAVKDARMNYSTALPEEKRNCLMNALAVVETHWSVSANDAPLRNRQQIRHALLSAAFLVVAAAGLIAYATRDATVEAIAYILGGLTIVAAEVSIAIWRISRDKSLHEIFEELRSLHSNSLETSAPSR